MQLGRQLSGTFATFPGRGRMEAHSSRSSSLFGELDDLPSSREVSEDVLYNPEGTFETAHFAHIQFLMTEFYDRSRR